MDIQSIKHGIGAGNSRALAKAISLVEDGAEEADELLASLDASRIDSSAVIGITGAPGAGKSTLTDKLVAVCRERGKKVGVIAIDPSSPISGGAIHGDRIRMMQHALDTEVVVRSMATRGRLGGLCAAAGAAARIMASAGCDPIIIETVGVGQSEMDIIRIADVTALVSAPGLGDDIQALKAGLLEVADLMVVNKADKPGAEMLAMELNEIARAKGRQVMMTVAAQGTGVPELFDAMREIFESKRSSGERDAQRTECRNMEVVDWGLEMLRPYLYAQSQKQDLETGGDPRIRAKRIVDSLLACGKDR
ncbi:methylmalonyl Co-A mutase-associated GTPase MeaB [Desulfovermiculus halophilus]|jgi:LAO/AO transport system kinase|uniref:methylmalonyl Co-A mutase-associated GTPase MeaB n=1 Tax=Desulfovermiculus halophilus TaxID=339722 RepID=UPI00055234BF|nr:methylmalonyl Co-A mutase-associated GTPase MeaB [Desulfovermiculus halophilus]